MNEGAQSSIAPTDKDLRWVLAALAAVLALQIELIWSRPVNWDEFFHLSEAHAFARGELTELLQVFYARTFFWLGWLGIDEIGQIRLARLFMLGCELVTCAAIVGMARRFASLVPALLAALAYLSAGYVLQHGVSFRADPMLAAALMAALWILLQSRLNWGALFAVALLCAMAVLISIKLVLFAPAFAAVGWIRWREAADKAWLMRRAIGLTLMTAALAGLLVWLTALTLPRIDPAGGRDAARSLSSAGTMMFNLGLFPRWPYLVGALGTAPMLALFLLRTIGLIRSGKVERDAKIAALLMIAPLVSVAFYANSFPYFYAFILAPVAVALSLGAADMLTRMLARVPALAMAVLAALSSLSTPRTVQHVQREVLAAVHQVFPQPVDYFDFPGMVPEFRKANFFMTVWGTRKYHAELEPSFAEIMAERTVPLLLLNNAVLAQNQHSDGGSPLLTEVDRRALRDGYIEHWGPIWVAGHRFATNAPTSASFAVHAPGVYTLEGSPALIDGRPVRPSQVIELTRGVHRFERQDQGETVLRWGNHLKRPDVPFSGRALFKDF